MLNNCFTMIDAEQIKLKQSVTNCMIDAMSQDTNVRSVAERKLLALETMEAYALILMEIAVEESYQSESSNIKQMSAILLKQFIDTHWNATESNSFMLNAEIKARIRKHLLGGLLETDSKIRNSFAYCVSYVAASDFQTVWFTFFQELKLLTESGNRVAIQGVLRVFEDIIRDAEPRQLDFLIRPLLTETTNFLYNGNLDISIKIQVLHLICLLINLYTPNRDTIQETIDAEIPQISEFLIRLLQIKEQTIDDYSFKSVIILYLTIIMRKIPHHFSRISSVIMPIIWSLIVNYAEIYVKSFVHAKPVGFDFEDEEGKLLGFSPLLLIIFEFITNLIESTEFSHILKDVLDDLFYYLLIFLHITQDMENSSNGDSLSYIEDDYYECCDSISIRFTANDLLKTICSEFNSMLILSTFSRAFNRIMLGREFTISDWKIHELAMFTLGNIKDLIMNESCNDNLQIPLLLFIDSWQYALKHTDVPLFLGRAMWFGGKFSSLLREDHFNNYIQATCRHIKDNSPILKNYAIRSIIGYCEGCIGTPNKNLLLSVMPSIVDDLVFNLNAANSMNYLFIINLHALKVVLTLNPTFAKLIETEIMPILIDILKKHYCDPDVTKEIKTIVKIYCGIPSCCQTIQRNWLPIIQGLLNSPFYASLGFQNVAIELLQIIVQNCQPPLHDNFINLCFPSIVRCIMQTDDQHIMSIGGECIRSYLLLATEQIYSYVDENGTTGLEYILRIVNHLLEPSHPEGTCQNIGPLLITLINKAGNFLGANMHFILKAILSKLQRVDQMSIWQSLLIVFLFLFYTHYEAVYGFLTSVPGPDGSSALSFILKQWILREKHFIGTYDRTVSILALTKILEYSETSHDQQFLDIMVRHGKGQNMTEISFLIKAFKIICREIASQFRKSNPSRDNETYTSDEDLSDNDSQIVDAVYETRPDQIEVMYGQDPVFQVNLLSYLTDFLMNFKNVARFDWYVNSLSNKEKIALQAIGIYM